MLKLTVYNYWRDAKNFQEKHTCCMGFIGHVIHVGCEILCSAILVKLLIIFWKIKDYFMSVTILTILKLYLFSQ